LDVKNETKVLDFIERKTTGRSAKGYRVADAELSTKALCRKSPSEKCQFDDESARFPVKSRLG